MGGGEPTRITLTSSTTVRPREFGACAAAVEGKKHLIHTITGEQGQQGAKLAPAVPGASPRLEVRVAVAGQRDYDRLGADLHRQQTRKLVQVVLAEAGRLSPHPSPTVAPE